VNEHPACPFCGARAAERVGQWGGQMITAQWRCDGCNSYFEAVRDDFDDEVIDDRGPATDRRVPIVDSDRA
jgi:sarcosine oxidase delta subunit